MQATAQQWVASEFAAVGFGDRRLDDRFRLIMLDLLRHCGKTLASSFESWSKIKASYRFFANPRVSMRAMLAPHICQTLERVRACSTVLVVQDTTYFDFSRREKTKGLDLTQRSKKGVPSKGLMLHNTMAFTPDGQPLGLLDQRFIERQSFHGEDAQEKREIRHCNEAIDVKESRRWIDVIRTCHAFDTGDCRTVHVCDREGDIYELFRDAAALGEHVLIRAARNRAINKTHRREQPTEWLFDTLINRRAQGRTTIKLQVNGSKKYRKANLSIIYLPITMPPPLNRTAPKDGTELPMVTLTAIMAIEKQASNPHDKLCWVLLTDLPIADTAAAIEKVQWYTQRWNIEIFHKVLKSGCAVEKAQLETALRLKKYIVLKSLVAWRLFWLARLQSEDGSAPCDTVLEPIEWQLLFRKLNKTVDVPTEVPSLDSALVWIARLGGYIARPSDPPPGVVSLWRGWVRLAEMVDDYRDICGSS